MTPSDELNAISDELEGSWSGALDAAESLRALASRLTVQKDVGNMLRLIRKHADELRQDARIGMSAFLHEAASTIEALAVENERLKEENKALGIADAHHFDEYAELQARVKELEAVVEAAQRFNKLVSNAHGFSSYDPQVVNAINDITDALSALKETPK